MKDLVELHDLAVRRGRFSLEIPRWSAGPGQVIGVVGPNGAGKTTLLETLAGLLPASAGRVSVLGLDPWAKPVEVRSALGFMSEDMPLFPMRVGALLRLASGYYPSWDAALVEELLQRFELDASRKVHELSRGQGTRVRLLLALAFRPRLLVLDEPAAGLDLAGRRALLESVLEVVRDPERTVIFSSNQLGDVERIADRLLVLDAGQIVRQGPSAELVHEDQTLEEALVLWGAA